MAQTHGTHFYLMTVAVHGREPIEISGTLDPGHGATRYSIRKALLEEILAELPVRPAAEEIAVLAFILEPNEIGAAPNTCGEQSLSENR